MNEPIKSGDRAQIIAGALGDKGPNVGKIVRVGLFQGEHSRYGRIWRVHGENLVSEYGGNGTEVDCAQSWLRKLPPDTEPPQTTTSKREVTA